MCDMCIMPCIHISIVVCMYCTYLQLHLCACADFFSQGLWYSRIAGNSARQIPANAWFLSKVFEGIWGPR